MKNNTRFIAFIISLLTTIAFIIFMFYLIDTEPGLETQKFLMDVGVQFIGGLFIP